MGVSVSPQLSLRPVQKGSGMPGEATTLGAGIPVLGRGEAAVMVTSFCDSGEERAGFGGRAAWVGIRPLTLTSSMTLASRVS